MENNLQESPLKKSSVLVTICDRNFLRQAKQALASAYLNAGWQGDYLLLTSDLPEEEKAWFEKRGIYVYDGPFLDSGRLGTRLYPPILLTKLYLFKEYFKKWSQVVFIDSDTIVRASLDNLLSRQAFSANQAILVRLRDEFTPQGAKKLKARCGFRLQGPAFSSGILVFNTNIIQADTFDRLLSIYREHREDFSFCEESTLNYYFYRNWQPIPFTYNCVPWYVEMYTGLKPNQILAHILHFACAKINPWDERSPYYPEWKHNLEQAEALDFRLPAPLGKELKSWRLRFYLLNYYLRFYPILFFRFIDRQIGRLGLLIKKYNPVLYEKIKRNK